MALFFLIFFYIFTGMFVYHLQKSKNPLQGFSAETWKIKLICTFSSGKRIFLNGEKVLHKNTFSTFFCYIFAEKWLRKSDG